MATVSAPLVLVKDELGAVQYVYKGSPLPSYVDAETTKRLVADGLVTADAPTKPAVKSAAKPASK